MWTKPLLGFGFFVALTKLRRFACPGAGAVAFLPLLFFGPSLAVVAVKASKPLSCALGLLPLSGFFPDPSLADEATDSFSEKTVSGGTGGVVGVTVGLGSTRGHGVQGRGSGRTPRRERRNPKRATRRLEINISRIHLLVFSTVGPQVILYLDAWRSFIKTHVQTTLTCTSGAETH